MCLAQLGTFADAQPLPERRALRGRVMGDNNLPIGGAAVTVRRAGPGSAGFWGTVVYTDARGDFVVPEAEEGAYSIYVEAQNFARLNGKAYELNQSSQPLEAVLQRLASFTVRVQGNDGKLLVNAPVSLLLHSLDGQTQRLLRSNADAKGELTVSDVAPAHYRLYAVSPGRGFGILDDVELTVGARREPLNLALKEGGTLRLTARETPTEAASGAAASGAAASDGRVIGGVTLTLNRKSQSESTNKLNLAPLFGDERSQLITSDTEGTLEITDVPPGSYTVLLMHTLYSAMQGKITPSMPREITITAKETTTADFNLPRPVNAQTASLRVLVQDAKSQPVVGANVFITLEQLSDAADLNQAAVVGFAQRRARTDDKGEFELYPLTVGNWRLRLYGASTVGAQSKAFTSPEPRTVKLGAEGGSITISVK